MYNVVHNTALNSSDKLPSYPPDNHHSSDDVYWRGGKCCSSSRSLDVSIVNSRAM